MKVVTDATLAAVTDQWQTAKQIHAKVDEWSHQSIRRHLRILAWSGSIERKIESKTSTTDVGYYRLWKRLV